MAAALGAGSLIFLLAMTAPHNQSPKPGYQ